MQLLTILIMQLKSAKFNYKNFLKTFFLVINKNIGLNLQMSSGTHAKRQKTYYFHDKWEEDYFFVMFNFRYVCLHYYACISLPKMGNLERHFTTIHKRYEKNFSVQSEFRKKVKGIEITTGYSATPQSIFSKPNTRSKAAKIASHGVCCVFAKYKKAFQDEEMVEKAFIEAAIHCLEISKSRMKSCQQSKTFSCQEIG